MHLKLKSDLIVKKKNLMIKMHLKLKSDLIVKKKEPHDKNAPQVKKWSHSKKKEEPHDKNAPQVKKWFHSKKKRTSW